MSDPMMQQLAGLQSAEPDRARAERVQARCRARLARRASRAFASHDAITRGRAARVWQPLIALLGAVYLTDVIVQALGIYRLQ